MPMRKMVRVYWMNINTDGCLITQINLPFTIEIIGTSMYLFKPIFDLSIKSAY